jgi:hypothetical protein
MRNRGTESVPITVDEPESVVHTHAIPIPPTAFPHWNTIATFRHTHALIAGRDHRHALATCTTVAAYGG